MPGADRQTTYIPQAGTDTPIQYNQGTYSGGTGVYNQGEAKPTGEWQEIHETYNKGPEELNKDYNLAYAGGRKPRFGVGSAHSGSGLPADRKPMFQGRLYEKRAKELGITMEEWNKLASPTANRTTKVWKAFDGTEYGLPGGGGPGAGDSGSGASPDGASGGGGSGGSGGFGGGVGI